MLICLFAVIGEAISTFFKLPIPGSIIGLFLLLIALQLKWIRLRHIHAVAEFLIANMTILFLPAGVGIMERWNAISANIVPIILIIMGALVLNIVVIAVVNILKVITRRLNVANFFNTPLFGLTLSVLAYTIGLLIYRRFPNPLTTPLLVSTALIIVILHYTGISYKDYYVGGSYLNSLIIPSTVALAVPFYKNLHLMRHHYKSILIGSTVACVLNTSYTALIAKLFGMDYFLAISLFPKSVTTAMAVGISEKMQGITTVTLVVVVITGILTSVLGPVFLKMIGIKDPVAIGLSLGGTGHAVGTGTAFRYGQVAGAMGGLSIAVTGILYVFISPIVASLILK